LRQLVAYAKPWAWILVLGLSAFSAVAQDPVINFAVDDPEMSRAIAEARAHVDLVLSKLVSEDGEIHPALNLKAGLPVNQLDIEVEVIWVEQLRLDGDRFFGVLANEPAYLPGLNLGDQVSFTRADIADWSVFSTDGRMYGHYTTRVLLRDLPRSEAQPIEDLLSPDALPEAWR